MADINTQLTMDEIMNKLLYVPFNGDYKVEEHIKKLLTEEEFFENCFINPTFDKEIEDILKKREDGSNYEVEDFEFNLDKAELIQRLHDQKEEYAALCSWINTQQPDIYCIKGDAGTGKSTFLHYLKFCYRNDPIYWDVVDIQNATIELSILNYRVSVPSFHRLYAKAISAILNNLVSMAFPRNQNKKYMLSESVRTIEQLTNSYRKEFRGYFPREDVDSFFGGLVSNGDSPETICKKNAEHIAKWVKDILKKENVAEAFSAVLELYIYFVICTETTKHHIIALDNFERFIGTDEIYNVELTEFVTELRRIQRSIYENNHLSYQIIIFMRNTSVRMFTSEQANELFPHTVDLSRWFDASSVLKKKIEWYAAKCIDIAGADILMSILNDMGAFNGTLRGLHFKISMLFNYNKRLVIRFLVDVISYAVNESYIKKYKYFWNECEELKPSLHKFAARSIIFRLILNSLRKDEFFIHIIEQSHSSENDANKFSGAGCARKILTILYNHYLANAHRIQATYMALSELVSRLFPEDCNAMELLVKDQNKTKLDHVAQVLYYMNYYDGRQDNWLQFIDIQYNHSGDENIVVSSPDILKGYIKYNYQKINVRITNAGIAYMYYVVSSFEFFSCKSINKENHKAFFGSIDIPPLLCSIPTADEIMKNSISSLTCIKTINVVVKEALSCISGLNHSQNPVPFCAKLNGIPTSHQERIMNAHRGFIDNFTECLVLLYKNQCAKDSEFNRKFNNLLQEIQRLRDKYSIDYGIGEDKK